MKALDGNGNEIRICEVCGKPLPRKRVLYCSNDCRAKALLDRQRESRKIQPPEPAPVRYCVCSDCGKLFRYRQNATRCTACQWEANKAAAREYERKRRAGGDGIRSIGSTEKCENCGRPYVLTGSHQRYCKLCSERITAEHKRALERERRAKAKVEDPEAYKKRRYELTKILPTTRECPNCGKSFTTAEGQLIYCSEKCMLEYNAKRGIDPGKPRKKRRVYISKLRTLRLQEKLTQQELAELIGMTVGTIYIWETRGHRIPKKRVAQLCELFNCSPGDIIDD